MPPQQSNRLLDLIDDGLNVGAHGVPVAVFRLARQTLLDGRM
jgi:hypothetical protein